MPFNFQIPPPPIPPQPPQPPQPVDGRQAPQQERQRNQDRGRNRMDSLPKTMRYDGTGNWLPFKQKFIRFAHLRQWTEEERKDNLLFCLEGKACEYYATILQRDENIEYDQLLLKMDKRFGVKEIPETAQVKLSTLKQLPDETIEVWGDRVLQLATKAYEDLPDEFMYKQAIKRICHGCLDREAGQYVANLNLLSIETAIDRIKRYQHNHNAIYEKQKREVREVRCENGEAYSDSSQSGMVCQIHKKSSQNSDDNKLGQRLSKLEDKLGALMTHLLNIDKRLQGSNQMSRSRSPSPARRSRSPSPTDICFHCQGQGHFKSNCPKLNKGNKSAKVTFANLLNGKGSREEA